MEKKALLAFGLSMLVMTVWFMLSPRPQPPQEPQAVSGKQASEQARPGEQKPAATKPLTAADLTGQPIDRDKKVQVEQEVTVETPLYLARFSSNGGKLLSWKLKQYRESLSKDSSLIDLVSYPNERGVFPLALRISDDIDSLINSAHFQYDKETVRLDAPGQKARLQARALLRSGYRVIKEFTFYADQYVMDLTVSFLDAAGAPVNNQLGLEWPHLMPDKSTRWSGYSGPVAFFENDLSKLKKPEKMPPDGQDIQWAGFSLKYFLSAIIPLNEDPKKLRLRQSDNTVRMIVYEKGDESSPGSFDYKMYLGPKTIKDLKAAEYDLERALDFGKYFGILSKPLLHLLMAINNYTHNYGIAIIVLTIMIKLLFWPLTHKSYASMKEMQRVQPRIKQLRERFKNDKQQLNREMMLLYKTHKVNPMGGCFPMLLQIPVFIALYRGLLDSIELRHAPFVLWLKDLSVADYLLRLPSGVSFFGIEGIGPLPLIMGASMVIQQKMTPTMGDPAQAKIMMLMPIFFTFIFISFPSGLVLYWLTNNVLSIVQQVYINSKLE